MDDTTAMLSATMAAVPREASFEASSKTLHIKSNFFPSTASIQTQEGRDVSEIKVISPRMCCSSADRITMALILSLSRSCHIGVRPARNGSKQSTGLILS